MDKFTNGSSALSRWKHVFLPGACLRVTGEDALSFLQGQFTQELRPTNAGAVAYGLWLSQKGKVLADSFVLREATDCLWIVSFFGNATTIRERLEAYIIADDVVIEDVTADWQGVVLGGSDVEAWLMREAGAVPGGRELLRVGDGMLFRGRRGTSEASFEWLLPVGASVPEGPPEIAAEEMERMRIGAGLPKVPVDIGPGDLPNEGGLDDAGVSYTKGCYLGQEVMARLKAMGTVRRRLVRVRASGRGVPAVPCALLQGEKRVGELRSAVSDGADGFIGLAMVTKLGLDPAGLLAPEPGGDGFIDLVDVP